MQADGDADPSDPSRADRWLVMMSAEILRGNHWDSPLGH